MYQQERLSVDLDSLTSTSSFQDSPPELPLFDTVFSSTNDTILDDVIITGVQHLLPTTRILLHHLLEYGLKPNNVSLLGKCYSTVPWVYRALLSEGFNVSSGSLHYDSNLPFDETFQQDVDNFLDDELLCRVLNAKKCIILDDGGVLISTILKRGGHSANLVALEQTSSGFHAIKDLPLNFPIINVARSDTKLTYESPFISHAIVSSIYHRLLKLGIYKIRHATVIGCGAIGNSIAQCLGRHIPVSSYDIDHQSSQANLSRLISTLSDTDLVVGCTGQMSLCPKLLEQVPRKIALASASSSDREFGAHELRSLAASNGNCHADIVLPNGSVLLNSGFPVNFTGAQELEHSQDIQLTRCLLAAGIFQAASLQSNTAGLIPLDHSLQSAIVSGFLSIQASAGQHSSNPAKALA